MATNYEKCPNCGKEYHSNGSTLAIRECKRCDKVYCEYCKGNHNALLGHVCYDGIKTINTSLIGWTIPKNKRKTDGWW